MDSVYKDMLIRIWILTLGLMGTALAVDYDEPPINYSTAPVDDPVARLTTKLTNSEAQLTWDDKHGWLPSLLALLDIPQSSQVLVYSKTSLQRTRISPDAPRAIYFNDEVYVGTVQHGAVLEIASTDPRQGTIFYVLPQNGGEATKPHRETHDCLSCHDATGFTGGVPGLVVRSVYTAADGRPILTAGSHVTDQRSPWQDRWGGWYITGNYGKAPHLGNQVFTEDVTPETVDRSPSVRTQTLADLIDVSPYLTKHSDVVAMMMLVHQTQMHNFLTRASYEGRKALRDDQVMNEALGRPADYRSDTTKRRLANAAEMVLRHLLYVDEAPLPAAISGSSSFSKDFTDRGPRDPKGRSLRDFDLQRRLLTYPCSHLIYSESFDALPIPVRDVVLERLLQVLTGQDTSTAFSHLSVEDRRAILEILVATKPGLPPTFAAAL